MNIRESFIEAVELFKKASALNRIFITISFFLSLSSIASLSENVFKWKGFILEAVNFYQEFIVETLISYANVIGFSYTQNQINSAVMLSIAVNLGMRMFILDQLSFSQVMQDKYRITVEPKINLFRIQAVAYTIFVWLSFGLSDDEITLAPSLILLIAYPLFLSFIQSILVRFDKNKIGSISNISYCKVYYMYLVVILLYRINLKMQA